MIKKHLLIILFSLPLTLLAQLSESCKQITSDK